MELEYILNELSIELVATIEEAREVMHNFIRTTNAIRNIGFIRMRFANKSIKNIELTQGYIIENWLKDEEVNSDLRDAFRKNCYYSGSFVFIKKGLSLQRGKRSLHITLRVSCDFPI